MTATNPQFLRDAARTILNSPWEGTFTNAEIVGLYVRPIHNSYSASG